MHSNPELARTMGIEAVVPPGDLIGAILYCGPYDLKRLYDGPSWFGRFFVRQMGWAYFGVKDWRDIPQASQAATVSHVTSDFPPTFITDGNSGSFEDDAKTLEAKIRESGVYVESLYYSPDQAKLPHEYQFDFSRPEAVECLNRTVAFLRNISKENE
jgi:acetyl esterase/lipase